MTAQTIIIGAVAYDPKAVTIWEGIREFFHDQGCALDYVLFSNYESQVDALFNGFIDIAWNTNLAYIKTNQRANGKAKILGMRDTDLNFKTRMIALADTTFGALPDLRGKRVAFGSKDSVQAAIIPEYYLREAGLTPDMEYKLTRFNSDVGKHGDTGTSEQLVLEALLSGAVDAGAVGDSMWNSLENGPLSAKLRCFWTSPGYSHCNFTALPQLASEKCRLFSETLQKMDFNNPEHRPVMELEGLTKWVGGDGDGYKTVATAIESTSYAQPAAPV